MVRKEQSLHIARSLSLTLSLSLSHARSLSHTLSLYIHVGAQGAGDVSGEDGGGEPRENRGAGAV